MRWQRLSPVVTDMSFYLGPAARPLIWIAATLQNDPFALQEFANVASLLTSRLTRSVQPIVERVTVTAGPERIGQPQAL
jgi:hypothetical protein